MKTTIGIAVAMIIISASCTCILRAVPFVLFGRNNMPEVIKYLGKVLPPAIIAVLIIYCLKQVVVQSMEVSLPTIISIIIVAAVHLWKKNTIISITIGTVIYMILIRI